MLIILWLVARCVVIYFLLSVVVFLFYNLVDVCIKYYFCTRKGMAVTLLCVILRFLLCVVIMCDCVYFFEMIT